MDETLEVEGPKVSICALLCQARFFFAAVSGSLCYFTYTYMEPILAARLLDFNLTTT